jgi:hypothetical protein
MKLITVSCNECGAKLSVGDDTRFVTCKHCDTQLAVHHEDGGAFTQVAEAARRLEASAETIATHADKMATQNERLLIEGKLARLDREWEQTKQGYMHRSKDGSLHPATRGQAYGFAVMVPLMFLPLVGPKLTSPDYEPPAYAWLLCLALAAGLSMVVLKFYRMAERYERAVKNHEEARAELIAKLNALEPRPAKKKKLRPKSRDSVPR